MLFLLYHHYHFHFHFFNHLHFHNHHLHNHLHLHFHFLLFHFLLFYFVLFHFLLFHFHFHFCLLDFLILLFCQLKLYLINHRMNLIIFYVQGYAFYILLFLHFLFRLMYLNLFSIYFTNCIISNIIKQVFNINILKLTYFILVIKFAADNNS